MITKYKQQAGKSFRFMAICLAVGVVSVMISSLSNPPILLGVALAILIVLSFSLAVVFYFRGCNFWAHAKGYSSVVFLAAFFALVGVVILIFLLPDESNSTKLAEEESYTGPRCVACNSHITTGIRLCPKCGWTQPAQDVAMPVVV